VRIFHATILAAFLWACSEDQPQTFRDVPSATTGTPATSAGPMTPLGPAAGSAGGAAGGAAPATTPPMTQGMADTSAPSTNGQASDAGSTDTPDAAGDPMPPDGGGVEPPADAGAGLDAGADAGTDAAVATEACEGVGSMRLDATIVVGRGETFDGQCRRYVAGSALGDGSQAEGQMPMFRLEDGARLINVVLGSPAADGVHTYGDVTLANIVWEDIGEDALTIKASGTVELDGGSAVNGEDKVFQINAASTFRVSNFRADNAGKFIRQNGGTTFRVDVYIDRCDISNMDEAIFRTDSSQSRVTLTNTRYHNIGDSLFIGVNAANITQSGNQAY
jgi:pectate lyase C